ncbi:MAG: GDSL-type esterase/lipase family protein [Fuerstiella sp.]
MNELRMQSPGCSRPLGAVLAVIFSFCTGDVRGNSDILLVPIADTPTWLRQSVRISGPMNSPLELRLTASGSVSAYFNGQRLLKNSAMDGGLLTWDVTSLAREGVNCVAVSIVPQHSAATGLGAGCFRQQQNLMDQTEWKIAPTPPPVGWQQTDFNGSDWQTVASTGRLDMTTLPPDRQRRLDWRPVSAQPRGAGKAFRFRDGDHVLLVGGTFVERAQTFGHLESALTAAASPHKVTFRNLGWSADTVFAESRGIFDTPAKGYERLIEHIRAEEPSAIMLFYGQNEAMSFDDGPDAIKRFSDQLRQLHRDLTTTGADIVFVSPHPFLAMAAPLPDPSHWNNRVAEFCRAVETVADSVGALYVDLFADFAEELRRADILLSTSDPLPTDLSDHPEIRIALNRKWTDNGMHWNDAGNAGVAQLVAARIFDHATAQPVVRVNVGATSVSAVGGVLRNIRWNPDTKRLVTFEFLRTTVSAVPTGIAIKPVPNATSWPAVQIVGENDQVVSLSRHPHNDDDVGRYTDRQNTTYENLRQLVVRRNELYFHRWRPQNITYLFGFRKHEQGNNASEIAQFDPLIDELEEQIHTAKQPQWLSVTVALSD